jgi:hypothetical protein
MYAPCCEPAGPTRGLWPQKVPLCNCQEYWMCYRDFLTWFYTRPQCYCGLQPASDASMTDWLLQWVPFRNHPSGNAPGANCPVRVLPPTMQSASRD